jgi:SAM-dependent methyltransferase
MSDYFAYDFGYSWPIAYGHLLPLALSGLVAAVAAWRGRGWLALAAGVVGAWALAGLLVTHVAFRINAPVRPASERFLASGSGRVLDIGAGSGRAAIGLLLARPHARVTALDLYDGYFGIEGNTPERLLANARVAGVEDRIEARTADMRSLPFADAAFDGAISVAAVDHLPGDDIPVALAEIARVLKPRADLLLTIVDVDIWARLASPHGIGHHPPANRERWHARLQAAGFRVVEEGKGPAARHFLASRIE